MTDANPATDDRRHGISLGDITTLGSKSGVGNVEAQAADAGLVTALRCATPRA